MRRAALALVVLISTFAFASVVPIHEQPPSARATPSLSGAKPTWVPNGSFSGQGLGMVGVPPANYDFSHPDGAVGSPVGNHNFSTGLTGWATTGGTPIVFSGGPSGNYLELGGLDKVLSDAFTVHADAEVFQFDFAAATSSYNVTVAVKYGAGYASTVNTTVSCSTTCPWTTREVNAVPFRGQSVKFELSRVTGTAFIDNAGVMYERLGGWTTANGTTVSRSTGGPTGGYVSTTGTLTSPAFNVDINAQNGQADVKIDSGQGLTPSRSSRERGMAHRQRCSAATSAIRRGVLERSGSAVSPDSQSRFSSIHHPTLRSRWTTLES